MPDEPTNTQPVSETQTGTNQPAPAAGEMPADFEKWLDAQSEPIKNLYQAHTAGLKNALDTERNQRKEAEKQLRDAGSEAQKQLDAMANQLASVTRKAAQVEELARSGIRAERINAALTLAAADNLVSEDGKLDLTGLKSAYPELFAAAQSATIGPTNPGSPVRYTREALAAMTPEEINKNWPAISAAMERMK